MEMLFKEKKQLICKRTLPFTKKKEEKKMSLSKLKEKYQKESLIKKLEYLGIGVLCFFIGIYSVTRDSQISQNELESFEVILIEKPEFINGKMDYYKLTTKGYQYQQEFWTSSFATRAINNLEFERELKIGDKLTLLKKKNDDRYTIYGVRKGDIEYVNLKKLNQEQKEDDLLGIIGIVLGIISVIYILWDEKIPLPYETVMCATFAILFLLMSYLDYYNLLVKE